MVVLHYTRHVLGQGSVHLEEGRVREEKVWLVALKLRFNQSDSLIGRSTQVRFSISLLIASLLLSSSRQTTQHHLLLIFNLLLLLVPTLTIFILTLLLFFKDSLLLRVSYIFLDFFLFHLLAQGATPRVIRTCVCRAVAL